ncbi:DUF4367 domain-containing protein [Lederbergia sp. NSJ-179]|uniref:DUF4367 domain-containing protein n=1 Tax=Lederbergia sp. NSJ-179 TaxID=2931402 RepID=UPI001FD00A43|nr:DUF4367 domain-containing protein [Lederbergia sp. NSJ-179]MCJ7840055.1 DUF4367 domain-containing protein [Lederbergia sp. NSJ-179]
MSREKSDSLDQLIKESIHEEMEQAPSPMSSLEEAWEKLEESRKKHPVRRPRSFKKVWMYAASILLVLASVTLFSTSQGSASPTLTQFFQKVQGKVVYLFLKVGEDTGFGDPPQGESEDGPVVVESEIESVQMSLQEAQKETAFPIVVPSYIPKAYHLENVTVMKREDELSGEIFLQYEGANEEGFVINQRAVGEALGMGMTLDNEDAQIENRIVNGQQAQLLTQDDFHELYWVKEDQTYYSISGNLSKQEIIKIAESME